MRLAHRLILTAATLSPTTSGAQTFVSSTTITLDANSGITIETNPGGPVTLNANAAALSLNTGGTFGNCRERFKFW